MYLFLLIIAVATVVHAENSYVVISPAKIRPSMDFTISVNILKSQGDVVLSATILRGTTAVTTGQGTFKAGVPSTLSLKVPSGIPSAAYTLKVEGTGGLTFTNTTSLTYNSKELSLYIQLDKAIYKAGETVNFRILGVYPDMKIYTGLMDISVYDGASNKIKQWNQMQSNDGVVTQHLALSSKPVLGDWKIRAETLTANVEKTFVVAEYVLPKFKVETNMPSYVLTTDLDVTVTVKAKYTYDKPVEGSASVVLAILYSYNANDYTKAQVVSTVQTQVNGEAKVSFPLSDVKKITSSLDGHILIVTANVSESLTGNTMTGNGTVKLYDKAVVLEFPETNPNTFKPGLPSIFYLKVSQPDGRPVMASNQKVKVNTNVVVELPEVSPTSDIFHQKPTENKMLPEQQYIVPNNGLVAIPVDFPTNARSATIEANFQDVSTTLYLSKSHSPSSSYLQLILESPENIQTGDAIKFRVRATQPVQSLVYQILSRGAIVKVGNIDVNNKSEHTFSIISDPSMAPNMRIVVYYVRNDGEIVTDSVSLDISDAFINKVSISFNTTEANPGDDVKVTVNADSNSSTFLMGIDVSVNLLRTGNDITQDDVNAELKFYDTINEVNHFDQPFGCRNCMRRKRSIWWPYPIFYGGDDASQVFEKTGVKVITDALLYRYQEPFRRRFPKLPLPWGNGRFLALQAVSLNREAVVIPPKEEAIMMYSMAVNENAILQKRGDDTSSSILLEPKVRSNFVETWLWEKVSIGSNGTSSVVSKCPDTITSYVVSAFAVNSATGLGIAPSQAKLRVFRSFFVSLNLPYSVTRGEQLVLLAIVFNYMQKDMEVRVTLVRSDSFSIIVNNKGKEEFRQEDAIQTIFVKAGEAKSVYYPIIPNVLNKIDVEVKAQTTMAADAVRRQLMVEAEGVPKVYNIPLLIDLTDGKKSFSQMVNLSLPDNVVKDSQRFRVSAVGDLMGPTITGLENLIQMPIGCGEQTIIILAPVVAVFNYLKAVNQLSLEIKSKALSYMESGYQRELTYKHKDGSFSAFGESDKSGSTWLTGFVIRVFHQAQTHIFIEKSVIIHALRWIIEKQNSNGSFHEPGIVIHKNMQGNVNGGTGLTVFILISLLENKDILDSIGPSGEQALAKALAYVEAEVDKTEDLYILAMASYALQLAKSTKTKFVLDKLEKKASLKDGLKFWQQEEAPKTTTQKWESPNPTKAINTEMTSYIALAYIARGELAVAKTIVQWIILQRNPNGGFQSTQDTVIALFALSEFAKQIYSNNFNLDVTVTLSQTQSYNFHIDQTNALIYQTQETTTVPSKVKVYATGSGVALVDISVYFNVESEIEKVTFELTVKLLEETINYLILETCTRWLGEGPSSNMAVQEVGIPSGFEPDPESITRLPTLKLTEIRNKKLILYFDKIDTSPVCLNIRISRTGLVAKSQPVPVRVYDYYSPENQVTTFYQSEALKRVTLCDICKDCENCVKV